MWTISIRHSFWTRPGPRLEFRVLTGSPSFDWVTRSAGSIPILKKIQNGIILVKKKKQKSTGCNRVFDRVLPGQPARSAGSHWVMTFPIFSSTRSGSSPGSRVDTSGRAGFQNYAIRKRLKKKRSCYLVFQRF